MSGQPTRAGLSPEATSGSLLARAPAEWRGFFAFLRDPVLPDRAHISLAGSARALPPLLALDMALMAAVLGAIGLATWLGLTLPEHMLNELKLTPMLIGFMVVGAPIAEEIIFRGWLSGRPGHILGSLAFAMGVAVILMAAQRAGAGNMSMTIAGIGMLAIALALVFGFRSWGALAWFQRHFRWFYYASALLFAAMHLTNFGGALSLTQLPLVLPQLMLGLILGYLRVNRGLLTGMTLHMLHNCVFAGLLLAGAS